MSDPWGINPNSEHQRWSRWTAAWHSPVNRPGQAELIENARRYIKMTLKPTMGRVRCEIAGALYRLVIEVEGPPAHDSIYVKAFWQDFQQRFILQGFGPSAHLEKTEVGLLAGDAENGAPPAQLLVLPPLPVGPPT